MMGQTTTQAPGASTLEAANSRLALVIPTLNEEGNIGGLLGSARAVLEAAGVSFEILVVDDDSRDQTGAIVRGIAEKDPRVRLIARKGERGLSGAIVEGWHHTDAGVLGVMDADLQHPPELLPELYRAVVEGSSDLAIGSRYTEGGGIGDWNAVRRLLSSAAVRVTWPLQKCGARAHDPMSGFFMVRRRAVEGIEFQRSGFKLLLEVLIRGRVCSVKEVPFAFGLRSQGRSKANLKVGWDYAWLLARLYARKWGLARGRKDAGAAVRQKG